MEDKNGLVELKNLYSVLCKTYDLTRSAINKLCNDLETFATCNSATNAHIVDICDKIGGKV